MNKYPYGLILFLSSLLFDLNGFAMEERNSAEEKKIVKIQISSPKKLNDVKEESTQKVHKRKTHEKRERKKHTSGKPNSSMSVIQSEPNINNNAVLFPSAKSQLTGITHLKSDTDLLPNTSQEASEISEEFRKYQISSESISFMGDNTLEVSSEAYPPESYESFAFMVVKPTRRSSAYRRPLTTAQLKKCHPNSGLFVGIK